MVMGVMMVVVAVVIPTRSFIQGFSTIATPLPLMLRTSSSTDSSTRTTQIVVKFDGIDAGSGAVAKSVKKSSKS